MSKKEEKGSETQEQVLLTTPPDYAPDGSRVLGLEEIRIIVFMVLQWFNDYMQFLFNDFCSKYDKSHFPMERRGDIQRIVNFSRKEIDLKLSLSRASHIKCMAEAEYAFNRYVDDALQTPLQEIMKAVEKKLCSAQYKKADIIAAAFSVDIVWQVEKWFYDVITNMLLKEYGYGGTVRMRGLIPKLGTGSSSNMEIVANAYIRLYNKGAQVINLNSKKLGIDERLDELNKKLFSLKFLSEAYDAIIDADIDQDSLR